MMAKKMISEAYRQVVEYEEYLLNHPEDGECHYQLALLCIDIHEYEKSVKHLQQALYFKSPSTQLTLHYALALKLSGEFEQAKEVLRVLLTKEPKCTPAWNNLGTIYFKLHAYHEAIECYQQAIFLQADYIDAYYNLGLAYQKAGYITEATEAYESILHLDEHHQGANFQLGMVCMRAEENEKALVYFKQILKLDAQHFESLLNMGMCLMKLGQWHDAQIVLLNAYKINGKDTQLLYNLGVLATQCSHWQEAVRYYREALSINPNLFEVHYNLAIVYLTIKDKQTALLHFHAALKERPDNQSLRHIIAFLSQSTQISNSPIEYVRSLFNTYAHYYDQHLMHHLSYHVPQHFTALLAKHEQFSSRRDILDLGCGTGLCGEAIQSSHAYLTGVDASAEMLKKAEAKGVYAALICKDVIDFLRHLSHSYDGVMAGDSLVYWGDLNQIMGLVYQALKPGGWFIFNLEQYSEKMSEGLDFKISESGRFLHAKAYLDNLILANNFVLIKYELALLRKQNGVAVMGHYYLLHKQG